MVLDAMRQELEEKIQKLRQDHHNTNISDGSFQISFLPLITVDSNIHS